MGRDTVEQQHPAPAPDVRRFLIVNADDFGRTDAINRGIIEAHERGIVTSASLMVSYPAAAAAAAYARDRAAVLSVGLHLDLSEWRYRGGEWEAVYQRIDTDDAAAVRVEFERQLNLFEGLMGRAPTHIDSHQHVHTREPVRAIVLEYARRQHLPVRACDEQIAYCGSFYGQTTEGAPLPQAITPEQLRATLASLPNEWTELGCHPGYAGDWETDYRAEREQELRTLCDPRLPEFLADSRITLRSFADFSAALAATS